MGDTAVKVMRDTGCTGAVVRRRLVKADQFTGKEKRYRMLDGTEGRAPIAKIFLKSPCFTGELEVLCIEKPLYDLIVGNVSGVRDSNDASTGSEVTRKGIELIQEEENIGERNAVTTRLQAEKKEEPYKELQLVQSSNFDSNAAELRRAQRNIKGMRKLTQEDLAKSGAKEHSEARAKARTLEAGDHGLLRQSTLGNKLLGQWKGPSKVTERVGPTEIRKRDRLEEVNDTFSGSPNNTGLGQHRSQLMKEEPVRNKLCPMNELGGGQCHRNRSRSGIG